MCTSTSNGYTLPTYLIPVFFVFGRRDTYFVPACFQNSSSALTCFPSILSYILLLYIFHDLPSHFRSSRLLLMLFVFLLSFSSTVRVLTCEWGAHFFSEKDEVSSARHHYSDALYTLSRTWGGTHPTYTKSGRSWSCSYAWLLESFRPSTGSGSEKEIMRIKGVCMHGCL